jgi:hypothetical protein
VTILEKVVEKYYCEQIKKAFPTSETFKFEVRRGEPDRISLLPGGRAIFIELKRPGKKLRPEQERSLQRKRDLGFEAYWAPTKGLVDEIISEIKLK